MSTHTIKNLRPAVVKPGLIPRPATDVGSINSETIAERLNNMIWTPVKASSPASLTRIDTGALVTQDETLDILTTNLFTRQSPGDGDTKQLLNDTLLHYDSSDKAPLSKLFMSQDLRFTKYPSIYTNSKTQIIKYSVDDVYSAARELYALTGVNTQGTCAKAQRLLAEFRVSVASLYKADTRAIVFQNDKDFKEFANSVKTIADKWVAAGHAGASINNFTKKLLQLKFQDELVTGIGLYPDAQPCSEDYSFARAVDIAALQVSTVSDLDADNNDTVPGVTEFIMDLNTAVDPEKILFINIENHATRGHQAIDDAWKSILSDLHEPITMVSYKSLAKMGSATSALKKMSGAATQGRARTTQRRVDPAQGVSASPPSVDLLLKDIEREITKLSQRQISSNTTKVSNRTYSRPPRRRPVGNAVPGPGKIRTNRYRPDIHLYVDTSGSISAADYRDSLNIAIGISKKFNCDLYFSSFSDVLSPETKVPTKGRTHRQIGKLIEQIPKVSGGTEFQNVWDNINALKCRKDRFNIMVTDFGYSVDSSFTQPKNLYYTPAFDRSSNYSWETVRRYAPMFINSATPYAPDISKRVLGIGPLKFN